MSYTSMAAMAEDQDLRNRLYACAASERIKSSQHWVNSNMWELASTPGWAGIWESTQAGHIDRPGFYPHIITDQAILSAVQAHKTFLENQAS